MKSKIKALCSNQIKMLKTIHFIKRWMLRNKRDKSTSEYFSWQLWTVLKRILKRIKQALDQWEVFTINIQHLLMIKIKNKMMYSNTLLLIFPIRISNILKSRMLNSLNIYRETQIFILRSRNSFFTISILIYLKNIIKG